MTVEEFRLLHDPPGKYLELHAGKVVELKRPEIRHWKVQARIQEIFTESLGHVGPVTTQFPFRPKPEYELWTADVAWLTWERFEEADDDDNPAGAPEIVVEILSPWNTASEVQEKASYVPGERLHRVLGRRFRKKSDRHRPRHRNSVVPRR